MEDTLELLAFLRIAENDVAHGRSVQGPVCSGDAAAKSITNFIESRAAACYDLPGNHVGVDNTDTESAKKVSNERFPAGNTAGQADDELLILLVLDLGSP